MEILTAKQQRFIRRYEEWIDQVVDALMMVVQFYRDGHEEQGDRLLTETMAGFERFGEENMTMQSVFGQSEEHLHEWDLFQQQINEALEVPAFAEPFEKIGHLTKGTLPAFQRWHTIVGSVLTES
ncbi:hypothetical protein [Salicibibacter kimchii]|uniref:DUF8042 domain-containing protein n=1 Tax=Salicibibacter kimchii TaxID=2099786 RepID=A0A345BZC1_9BACI|nr:hypothetical protein [Salicibibacter kimchii]AXF56302.1 hypothetical protein DT065_09905 [Salicibibacter kimchii]